MGRNTPSDLARSLGLGRSSDDGTRYAPDERFGMMGESRRPDHWVRTTCGYCSVGCGMLIGVREGKAVSVAGDPDHPVNEGRLCPKGLSEHKTIDVEGRLTVPLVRRPRSVLPRHLLSPAGTPDSDSPRPEGAEAAQRRAPPVASGPRPALARATWDEAIDTMVEGFGRLLAEHGPDSVAVLSTGQLVTEEFYALGKLARVGFGLRHYDGNTTLCMASAVSGYKRSFGSDGPPGSYADFEDADCILLVGANIADNHPLLAPRVLENDGATVIVIDPRVTKTAMMADLHLPVKPRTDITMLNGMIKLLIDEGLVDRRYVDEHTEGFAELAAHVAGYDLDTVALECGVEAEALREATLTFGRSRRAVVAWTMGVNHSVQGAETVTLLNTLCLLTGNVGRPGAAPFSITGQCNAMGTREAGSTASLPGYRAWDSPADRAEMAALWGVPVDRIPEARGRAYPDIIDGVLDGTIKGLWIIATNPPVSFPNRGRLERALSKLELLVVQDGYQTPTTALADVVLPAAIWGEKDGTYTNSERRVSRVRRAVAPIGEARSDFDIFLAVAGALGVRGELFGGWAGPEDAFAEWARVSAGRLCDYSGITWDRIDAAGGVQWPCPPGTERLDGTPHLYGDGVFQTPTGRAKLWCVSPEPVADAVSEHYPFLLNTGRTVEHWHTRTKTGRVDILEHLAPEGWVEMNPMDASVLRVGPGDRVLLRSRRGQVEGIPVRVTATVRPGEVFMPFHYDELCVNRLTVDEFDPISREPNYKQSAVDIQPMVARPQARRKSDRRKDQAR